MRLTKLHRLFNDPSGLDESTFWELQTLVEQYPYYEPLRFLYLKNALVVDKPFDDFMKDVERFAISVQDKRKLLIYLSDDRLGWNPYYVEIEAAKNSAESVDVMSLIDTFVNERKTPNSEVQSSLTIGEPAIPYSIDSLLADLPDLESKGTDDKELERARIDVKNRCEESKPLDQFIELTKERGAVRNSFRSSRKEQNQPSVSVNEAEKSLRETIESLELSQQETDTFAESLAKIYIKQRKFDKAIEIFSSLSLKYPEKSVYFADQIRFLQLLIKNIKS